MRNKVLVSRRSLVLLSVIGVLALVARAQEGAPSGKAPNVQEASKPTKPEAAPADRIGRSYEAMPLTFEPNQGQAGSKVKFVSHGRGYDLYLTPSEAILALQKPSTANPAGRGNAGQTEAIRIHLLGVNRSSPQGVEPTSGKINYLIGPNRANWRTNVQAYAKVRYPNVYPGVDLIYHGNQRRLEYDFIISPGADPKVVRMAFGDITGLELDNDGNLFVRTAGGALELKKPDIYQDIQGSKHSVSGGYILAGKNVRFQVGAYDHSRPLVIDPVLVYSTYLGGNGEESGTGIAVDGSGNTYVTGFTGSSNFPLRASPSSSVLQSAVGGTSDAFVTKFDPTGKLIYSTYLGGSDNDGASGIAVDAQGNAYIAGESISFDFPVVNGFQTAILAGGLFKSANAAASWSPSGLANVTVWSLAVNPQSRSIVYAGTSSGVFKSTNSGTTWSATSLTDLMNGNSLVIDPVTTSNIYAGTTLFGIFKSIDAGNTWTLASTGLPHNGIIFGQVNSLAIDPTVPSTLYAGITGNGLFKSTDGGATWSPTTLTNQPSVIIVDPVTNTTVFAGTSQGVFKSLDAGATWNPSGLTTSLNSLAINPTSTSTLYAATNAGVLVTTDGGATWGTTGLTTFANAVVVDRANAGTLYASVTGGIAKSIDGGVTWNLSSTGLTQPSVNTLAIDSFTNKIPAVLYAGTNATNSEAFVAKLDPAGSNILYSTYLGGTGSDQAAGIAIDPSGNAYVTGTTASRDWPTTPGAFQTAFRQIFVAKLNSNLSGAASLIYSTFLGGSLNAGDDRSSGIAVDASGNAYITGRTHATNFPTTPGAYSATCGTDGNCNTNQDDAFVTELNPTGSALVYSTYLGGSGTDIARGIAVDSSGNIYIVGDTQSTDFPVVNAFQSTAGGGHDVFVSKLNPNLSGTSSLVYSTYLRGSGDDFGGGIAADNGGLAYVTGTTNSNNVPLAIPTQGTMDPGTCTNGCSDAFVSILNTTGTGSGSLVFSTYLGGSAPDEGAAVAVDSAGSVYVTGTTEGVFESTSPFPVTPGALQAAFGGGGTDAFVAKIASAGLSIFMTASGSTVTHGTQVTYLITVTNIGQNAFTGVTVADALPVGLTFVSASASCIGSSTVTCNLGTVAADSSVQVSIVATATGVGQISNTATVSANETNPTPSAATTTAVITVVSNADLSVTMTGNPSSVGVSGIFPDGGNIFYTIAVRNNGPDPVANVTVNDTLPVFLSLVSAATPSQGSCSFTSSTVLTCNLGTMADEGFATILLTGIASSQALGTLTNTATVGAGNLNDPVSTNNSASVQITARNRISDLGVSISGTTGLDAGGAVTYLIDVTNHGPDPAGGVHMLDTLDTTHLSFTSVGSPQGSCTFDGTTVDCDLGILNAGSTIPITLVAGVPILAFPVTQISNTARVGFTDLLGAEQDPVSFNDTATITTNVTAATSDLSITKTVSANPVPVGSSLTYTLTVTNKGPDTATGVVVHDTLPSGVTFSSMTSSQGACAGTTIISCQLGTISVGSTATVTIVVTPNSFGLLRNDATVTGNGDDPDFSNNTTLPVTSCVGTPLRQVNVAYIPVKYPDRPTANMTPAQLAARVAYIKTYYLQESMCAVQFNATIVSNPSSADGYWTLPSTEATYFPGGNNQTSGNTGPLMSIWTDAFVLASAGSPAFLVAKQAGFFDAIMVIDNSPLSEQRSASLMNEAVRDHIVNLLNPVVSGNPSVVAATLGGALAATIAGTAGAAGAFTTAVFGPLAVPLSIFATTLLAPSLPRVAVDANMFEQGSVVVSDNNDSETWAHELGHGIFSFWDYYGDLTSFSTRGDTKGWELMSNPHATPPAPIGVYNRQIAGWLQYADIGSSAFGSYPLTALTDFSLGDSVFRYQTPRNLLGYPKGPTAWYIFELRTPPDDVPPGTEQFKPDGSPNSFSAATAGQTGVIMYDKREENRLFGIAIQNPYCGAAHGAIEQGLVDTLIGLEFGSCLWKVNNVMQFPSGADQQFSLTPGGPSFVDDMINITFSLDSGNVLQIHGTAFSRTVVKFDVNDIDFGIPGGGFPSVAEPNDRFPIDLHVYTSDGRHFGPNYVTGNYELGINGARTGGAGTTAQWISIPDNVQASYVIDASQAAAVARAQGLQKLNVTATASIFRYDANGGVGKVTNPVQISLNLDQPTTGQISIPLGAGLGLVQDTTPPAVTAPASVLVTATEAGGARVSASQPLAAFLAGATAVDDVDPFVSLLPPQVGGVDVTVNTLFPLGTTAVTFRFQDASGKIGTAVSNVQVAAPSTVSLAAPSVPYGTPVSVTVSVNSASGNVTLSVDGGALLTLPLSNSSAVFNVGVLSAGTHTLAASFAAQGNFLAGSATGTVSVTPVPLTVAAANATRAYGAANPAFSASFSGFVNHESGSVLGGVLSCVSAAAPASPIGNYPINCSGLTSTNYAIGYLPGTLTVTRARVTVTANNLSRPFNTPNPPLTFTANGFANGETLSVLTSQPACTTTVTTTSPVGTYPITCSGAAAANYSFNYIPGSLTITCHYVTITMSPSSVLLGGTINVTGSLMSCANSTQIVSIDFVLTGALQPGTCGKADTEMFRTPPFALPPKTLQTVSFPFRIPKLSCPGNYTISATTLVNGKAVDTSTAMLTVTAK